MASYLHDSGTSDTTKTVPTDRKVARYSCIAGGSGGTITITPAGGSAQSEITVPASQPFGDEFTDPRAELGAGSTIAFAGMASWFVRYA